MADSLKSIQIGKKYFPLGVFNFPQISLSNKVLYIAHCGGLDAETSNQLASEICSLANELGANQQIDTQVTVYSIALIAEISKAQEEQRDQGKHHIYSKFVATGLKAGFSMKVAHDFAISVIDLFESHRPNTEALRLTKGTYNSEKNCITLLQGDNKSLLHLVEVEAADEEGEGKYRLEYPKDSPYDECLEEAKILAMISS